MTIVLERLRRQSFEGRGDLSMAHSSVSPLALHNGQQCRPAAASPFQQEASDSRADHLTAVGSLKRLQGGADGVNAFAAVRRGCLQPQRSIIRARSRPPRTLWARNVPQCSSAGRQGQSAHTRARRTAAHHQSRPRSHAWTAAQQGRRPRRTAHCPPSRTVARHAPTTPPQRECPSWPHRMNQRRNQRGGGS